jgi:hypothetical protein
VRSSSRVCSLITAQVFVRQGRFFIFSPGMPETKPQGRL